MNPVSGLAACVGKCREEILMKILSQMTHRALLGFHLYSSSEKGERSVGVCLRFQGEVPSVPIHGEIFEPEGFDLKKLHHTVLDRCFAEAAEELQSIDGAYSMIVADGREMVLIRDHLGQKPLYYVQKPDLLAAASEKNALQKLGYEVEEAPRNALLHLSYSEKRAYPIQEAGDGKVVDDLDEAAKRIYTLLKDSIASRLKRAGNVALGFSGGVDSTILAKIASNMGRIDLLCFGAEGSRDVKWGAKAAELIGLDAQIYTIDAEDVKHARNRLLAHRSLSTLDLTIAVGVELMARRVRESGYQTLMLGQLADELFGGYMRYQSALKSRGLDAAQRLMIDDILSAHKGLERDEYASAPYVDLCLPYASKPLVEYALKIHPRLKVDEERRKIVLRRVAEMLNLPKEIVDAPKKALQYSTGISKAIEAAKKSL